LFQDYIAKNKLIITNREYYLSPYFAIKQTHLLISNCHAKKKMNTVESSRLSTTIETIVVALRSGIRCSRMFSLLMFAPLNAGSPTFFKDQLQKVIPVSDSDFSDFGWITNATGVIGGITKRELRHNCRQWGFDMDRQRCM